MAVQLHLDGSGKPWALVRCEACADVNKFPAVEAAQIPVQCKKCGHSMDVRERLVAAAAQRRDVPPELLGELSAASRIRM